MRIALALLLLAASLSGAFAQRSERLKESDREVQATMRKVLRLIEEPLEKFRAEKPPSCSSENLKEARATGVFIIADLGGRRLGAPDNFQIGSLVLDVADEAKAAKCNEAARAIYDTVIRVFAGSAYAALRQRAQIGIDDIRAGKN